MLAYLLVAQAWASRVPAFERIYCDPVLAFCQSVVVHKAPEILAAYPKAYFDDFAPDRDNRNAMPTAYAGVGPRNVVVVVMESVGARYLGLYGAHYADTPTLERLAAHAAVFDRVYASNPISANAMVGILSSIYPHPGWQSLHWYGPDFRAPSLAAVLTVRGYRTAFIHSDYLEDQMEYLRSTFASVYDATDLATLEPGYHRPVHRSIDPRDGVLVPAACKWLDADRARPFLLVLWTDDTHHPYLAPTDRSLDPRNAELNRYLNAIEESDSLIGTLCSELPARGHADDTLLVVTGDHGELFGQHGHLVHGWTVSDDELLVPLVISNRNLFPKPVRIGALARQIDIAPTVAALLGVESAAQWQGESLFDSSGPRRAYCFAETSDLIFGFVEGNLKYVYDAQLDAAQVYDLNRDPGEQKNVIADPRYAGAALEGRQRLAAWVAFEDSYIDRLRHKPAGTPAAAPSPALGRVAPRE